MSEVYLSDEAVSVANAIRSIDVKLNDLQARINRTIAHGLRNNMVAAGMQEGREAADAEHARPLAERADLVAKLKGLVGDR